MPNGRDRVHRDLQLIADECGAVKPRKGFIVINRADKIQFSHRVGLSPRQRLPCSSFCFERPMKVLVTGATGLLGNNLVREMLRSGVEPICLVRPGYDPRTFAELDVKIIEGPWENVHFLRSAVQQADAVVHAAAKLHIGWHEVEESLLVNAGITARLAALALERRCRFIHVSTVDTLSPAQANRPEVETSLEPAKPECAYVVSKRQAEVEVLKAVRQGLDAIIVNPGFMVGPWDWKPSSGQMMLAIHRRYVPLAPAGGCCVVDVRDVCRGILASLHAGKTGQRYILGGQNVAYFELWREMASIVGRRPPMARLGAPLAWFVSAGSDSWARLTGREGLVNSAAIKMGQLFHFYSSEKAIRDFNYSISPYQPALTDAWNWFLEHRYAVPRRARRTAPA